MSSGKCDFCEKVVVFGRNIRHKHSGRWERKAPKTSRQFRPNVQSKKMIIDGKRQKVNICTKCIKTQMKNIILSS